MEERALAFVDLLGFSSMVKTNYDKAKKVLSDFYDISYELIKPHNQIQGNLFSDCLLAYSSDDALLINTICKLYRECLKKTKEHTDNNFFLLPRGGISRGLVNIQERNEAPNLRKNFVVSQALVHSTDMEQKIKGSRLLIATKTREMGRDPLRWNVNIDSILYKNAIYDIWDGYEYVDALWFSELSSDDTKPVRELLNIAADIVEANGSSDHLSCFTETLRIGLLTYARFFEAVMSENYISELLNRFSDEKYWEIWLALFEMALLSRDSWAVPAREDFVNFYKNKCLTTGWAKIIERINGSGIRYVNSQFQDFINQLSIRTAS